MKMLTKVTGKGRPLVLVPGGLTGWLSWEPHAERLSTNRKVVRVQLLNVQWGLEDKQLPSNYSVKMESQALAETISGLGFKRPIDIVAWSYGALITLDYALDHPDTIRTLTLIEPSAFWVLRATMGLDAEAQQHVATLETLHGDITENQLEQFASAVGLCPPGQYCRELPQWPLWVVYRQSLRNSRAVLKHNDDTQRLRGFKRPVLLVRAQVQPSSSTRLYMGSPRSFPKLRLWRCQQAMHHKSCRWAAFWSSWHYSKMVPGERSIADKTSQSEGSGIQSVDCPVAGVTERRYNLAKLLPVGE